MDNTNYLHSSVLLWPVFTQVEMPEEPMANRSGPPKGAHHGRHEHFRHASRPVIHMGPERLPCCIYDQPVSYHRKVSGMSTAKRYSTTVNDKFKFTSWTATCSTRVSLPRVENLTEQGQTGKTRSTLGRQGPQAQPSHNAPLSLSVVLNNALVRSAL